MFAEPSFTRRRTATLASFPPLHRHPALELFYVPGRTPSALPSHICCSSNCSVSLFLLLVRVRLELIPWTGSMVSEPTPVSCRAFVYLGEIYLSLYLGLHLSLSFGVSQYSCFSGFQWQHGVVLFICPL